MIDVIKCLEYKYKIEINNKKTRIIIMIKNTIIINDFFEKIINKDVFTKADFLK